MASFASQLASLNRNEQAQFGDPVMWISQVPGVAPYLLPGATGDGLHGGIVSFAVDQIAQGFFAMVQCVLLSDLVPALNGSKDLSVLAGDRVQVAGVTYRVQKVSDPDYSGTVTVELRKPSQ